MIVLSLLTAALAASLGGDLAGTNAPETFERRLPALLAQGDPADSLWRAGRRAISDEEWDRAVDIFARVRSRHPRSNYVGDSYYWQAYALYQKGSNTALRQAVTLLDTQLDDHTSASTRGEARTLRTRIRGALAQGGDEAAAAAISRIATDAAAIGLNAAAQALGEVTRELGSARGSASARASTQSGRCRNEEDDDRVMALNALLQMNSDDALPLLKEVMKRRDTCSEVLRRKAVFLISQKRTPESADILMDAARNDPDKEVREQAVFWLGSTGGDRAVTLLEQILKTSNDPELQDKAVFSLHNSNRPRAGEVLRDYALREDAPQHVREQAIFWLGQRRSEENAAFLKQLFGRVRSNELKDKIIFSLSQQRTAGNDQWLLDQAMNQSLAMEIRKQALFWAGQTGAVDVSKLAEVYDKGGDVEFKEQVIFVLSQKGRNAAAIDKLVDIAKNERNRDLREKAVFWLGQSRDPRALRALQDIILRPPEGE